MCLFAQFWTDKRNKMAGIWELKASQSKTVNRNLNCKMCFYFFANARGKLLSQRTNGTFGFANAHSQRKNQKSHFLANALRDLT